MKLSTLKSKVFESIATAKDAQIEFKEAVKIAKTNESLLSYKRMGSFDAFKDSVANLSELDLKLKKAISNIEEAKHNYLTEVLRVIDNIKKCLIFAVIGCVAIISLVAGLV